VSGWLGCGHQGGGARWSASAQDALEAELSGVKMRGTGCALASPRCPWGPRPASRVYAGVTAIETQDVLPSHAGGEAVRRSKV
jgi:hypothetical protein